MLEHRLLIYAPLFIYRQMGESTGVIPNSPQQVGYRGPPPGAPPSAERSQQPRSGTAIRQSLFADPPGSPSDSDEASRLADSLSDFSLDENGDLYRLKAGIHSKIEWTTTNSWCTEGAVLQKSTTGSGRFPLQISLPIDWRSFDAIQYELEDTKHILMLRNGMKIYSEARDGYRQHDVNDKWKWNKHMIVNVPWVTYYIFGRQLKYNIVTNTAEPSCIRSECDQNTCEDCGKHFEMFQEMKKTCEDDKSARALVARVNLYEEVCFFVSYTTNCPKQAC